jgi:3-hydroxy-9,10-secoandrosta-1,3,5(10)-triene-9,17-dione monooxygenase
VPFLAIMLDFPILGAVRTMLDLLLERLPSRGIQYTWYTKQAEATVTHLQVAEATAKIDCSLSVPWTISSPGHSEVSIWNT